jgi:hypothetical protein
MLSIGKFLFLVFVSFVKASLQARVKIRIRPISGILIVIVM